MKISCGRARSLSVPLLLLSAAVVPLQAQVTTYTFGTPGNTFTMDFVTIGNPGNLADTSPAGWGAVAKTFQMGKYEVSWDMVNKANTAGSLGITQTSRTANKPAGSVSWNEAARFVNWLNTSKGYSPAYKFSLQPGDGSYSANANILLWVSGDAGYNAANPYRNANAVYFLPSENEWYKAAYYDPNKLGGAGYFNYPTGSDSAPGAVASGTTAGTAVYSQAGPADITLAGGLSPYGTMGQGGNGAEWMESAYTPPNNSVSENRVLRGGNLIDSALPLESSYRSYNFVPTVEFGIIGFRVAAVPEPWESAGVIGVAALGFALWRRRGSL